MDTLSLSFKPINKLILKKKTTLIQSRRMPSFSRDIEFIFSNLGGAPCSHVSGLLFSCPRWVKHAARIEAPGGPSSGTDRVQIRWPRLLALVGSTPPTGKEGGLVSSKPQHPHEPGDRRQGPSSRPGIDRLWWAGRAYPRLPVLLTGHGESVQRAQGISRLIRPARPLAFRAFLLLCLPARRAGLQAAQPQLRGGL